MTPIEKKRCEQCGFKEGCNSQNVCLDLKIWAKGYKEALHDLEKEIDYATVHKNPFVILHVRDFIDKMLGRK